MVDPVVLQSDGWSGAFALALGALSLMALALIVVFNRFRRPDYDSRHAAHILTQLHTFGGTGGGSVVVRSVAALEDPDVMDTIRGLFHGESSGEPTVRSSGRDAAGEVVRSVRAELRDRKPEVSRVPARAIQEAILTAVFGAIAVVPLAAWREATRTGDTMPDLPDFVAGGQMVLDTLHAAVLAFPYASELFALALSFGILGADLIWKLWMVPPAVLITLAGTYLWLERRVDTDRPVSGPPIRAWVRRFAVLGAITWAVGAGLAALGEPLTAVVGFRGVLSVLSGAVTALMYAALTRDPATEDTDGEDTTPKPADSAPTDPIEYTTPRSDEPEGGSGEDEREDDPPPTVGEYFPGVNWTHAAVVGVIPLGLAHSVAALAIALMAAVLVAGIWTRQTLRRWRDAARIHGRDALALDIVHSVTVSAAALTLPLLAGYTLAAIGTGKVLRVGAVILAAPSDTVLAVGILGVVTVIALAVALLDQFRDVRRGIRRAMAVQSVRTVVFARAFPVLFAGALAVLMLGLGIPPVAAVASALTAGVGARMAYMGFNYVSFRARDRDAGSGSANRVVIAGRQVTDADGQPVFVADVNGHRTAHRDLDTLVGQTRRDARSLLRDGRPERGSFPRYYYREGVTRGRVDMGVVANELVGDIRTRFVANVKRDADADKIMDKLTTEYPPQAVQTVVQNLKDRGRVSRREGRFQWLGE